MIATVAPRFRHWTKRSADRRTDYQSVDDLATELIVRPFAGIASIPGRETGHSGRTINHRQRQRFRFYDVASDVKERRLARC
jgi:hypothetical protein